MIILYIALALILIAAGIFLYRQVRHARFFESGEFRQLREEMSGQIQEMRELSGYVEELMRAPFPVKARDFGQSGAGNKIECSLAVCDAAEKQPFKYLSKYFDIELKERELRRFEEILDRYVAAEEGQQSLERERERMLATIADQYPSFSRQKIAKELGLPEVKELAYPEFVFSYTSPGGNTGKDTVIRMDVDQLDRFVRFMAHEIRDLPEERLILTRLRREDLIERDQNRCRICGNSKAREEDLLLHLEHILPKSKGGRTREENLRAICWRCRREREEEKSHGQT